VNGTAKRKTIRKIPVKPMNRGLLIVLLSVVLGVARAQEAVPGQSPAQAAVTTESDQGGELPHMTVTGYHSGGADLWFA
jgi:hypothetical protein